MIEHYQIPIHEIEPVEFIACLFCVYHVLVDHVGGTFGSVRASGADLADGTKFAKEVKEGGGVDVVGQVLDEEDAVGFGGELVGARHCEVFEKRQITASRSSFSTQGLQSPAVRGTAVAVEVADFLPRQG